jgi:hypothetical protein
MPVPPEPTSMLLPPPPHAVSVNNITTIAISSQIREN